MSTIGVVPSSARKARTIASVCFMSCPALSARCDEAWIAGPSAIGSVNGMPSSITSAPAAGSALRIASDVSASGSPAVRNVTNAARPSRFKSPNRLSIRVEDISWTLLPVLLASGGKPHIGDPDDQHRDRGDQIEPVLPCQERPRSHHLDTEEIGDIGGRDGHHDPAD